MWIRCRPIEQILVGRACCFCSDVSGSSSRYVSEHFQFCISDQCHMGQFNKKKRKKKKGIKTEIGHLKCRWKKQNKKQIWRQLHQFPLCTRLWVTVCFISRVCQSVSRSYSPTEENNSLQISHTSLTITMKDSNTQSWTPTCTGGPFIGVLCGCMCEWVCDSLYVCEWKDSWQLPQFAGPCRTHSEGWYKVDVCACVTDVETSL